jgi:hypothetical protein
MWYISQSVHQDEYVLMSKLQLLNVAVTVSMCSYYKVNVIIKVIIIDTHTCECNNDIEHMPHCSWACYSRVVCVIVTNNISVILTLL